MALRRTTIALSFISILAPMLHAQIRSATMLDLGGYYKFRDPGFQLLFCYGHTVVGQTETYAYLGLYWTWGNGRQANAAAQPFSAW